MLVHTIWSNGIAQIYAYDVASGQITLISQSLLDGFPSSAGDGASDFITSGSIYLAVDSPLGPLYLAYGRSEDSLDAVYLSLGWPFLNNQFRMGR